MTKPLSENVESDAATRKRHDRAGEVADFVAAALAQDRLAGLNDVLARIAEAIGAIGCILWEAGPQAVLGPGEPEGTLHVAAEWFEDDTLCAIHDLPLEDSLTGAALLRQQTQTVKDAQTSPRVNTEAGEQSLRKAQIGPMIAVPVPNPEGGRFVITIYGRDRSPFSRSEVRAANRLASLVPSLYQTIRDKVSFRLLSRVKEEFDLLEEEGMDSLASKEQMTAAMRVVSSLIAETFSCMECAIYLKDAGESPGQFELMGTTWPERHPDKSFEAGQEVGLTPWVLSKNRPLWIFDLRRFGQDLETIRREHPGLRWNGLEKVKKDVEALPDHRRQAQPKPLSFMATPIRAGGRLLGCIRCFGVVEGPYYFAQRELDLLDLVGHEIGQRWAEWLRRRALHKENRSWHALVQSITDLNRYVYQELTGPSPEEARIFEKALDVAQEVLPGGEITDVRLLDEETDELYFAATYGSLWEEGDESVIRQRKARRFPVDVNNPASAGAWVVAKEKAKFIPDIKADPYYDGTFPDTRRMIIAPISVEDRVFGVLDIRGTGSPDFPAHAESIAALLGRQLGLYHYLAKTIARLRATESQLSWKVQELQRTEEEQTKAYEDLGHQLRSPILQAHHRATLILREDSGPDGAQERIGAASTRELLAVRGLSAKALKVVMNMRLFVDLARGQAIPLDRSRLRFGSLIRRLVEAASDTQELVEPVRRLRFSVERETFSSLRGHVVEVDHALLDQAVSNLLDNAAKYSFPGTTTRIFGGLTKSGRFSISVANRGIPLRPSEIHSASLRTWRSEAAVVTTGEGSGIGLWLVDSIMEAHGGELVVMPTDQDGWTVVKLVFATA